MSFPELTYPRLVLAQRRSGRGRDFSAASALIGRDAHDGNAEKRPIAINYMSNRRFALLPAIAAMVAASNASTEAM
jgi:hypothetical protein